MANTQKSFKADEGPRSAIRGRTQAQAKARPQLELYPKTVRTSARTASKGKKAIVGVQPQALAFDEDDSNKDDSNVKVSLKIRTYDAVAGQESHVTCDLEVQGTKVDGKPVYHRALITCQGKKTDEGKKTTFPVDYVYGNGCSLEDVHSDVGVRASNNCLDGKNHTIIVYGPSGAGKSHTLWHVHGLIRLILRYILERCNEGKDITVYKIIIYCAQVYKKKITDLLAGKTQLTLKVVQLSSGEICVQGLKGHIVNPGDLSEALKLVDRASSKRTVRATEQNPDSSRSSVMFTIAVEQQSKQSGVLTKSHLRVVDLPGSERTDTPCAESIAINCMLLQLGMSIRNRQLRVPQPITFRDCPLIHMLKDVLEGQGAIDFIGCLSQDTPLKQKIATLDWLMNAKSMPCTAQVQGFQSELQNLTEELQQVEAQQPEASQTEEDREHAREVERLKDEIAMLHGIIAEQAVAMSELVAGQQAGQPEVLPVPHMSVGHDKEGCLSCGRKRAHRRTAEQLEGVEDDGSSPKRAKTSEAATNVHEQPLEAEPPLAHSPATTTSLQHADAMQPPSVLQPDHHMQPDMPHTEEESLMRLATDEPGKVTAVQQDCTSVEPPAVEAAVVGRNTPAGSMDCDVSLAEKVLPSPEVSGGHDKEGCYNSGRKRSTAEQVDGVDGSSRKRVKASETATQMPEQLPKAGQPSDNSSPVAATTQQHAGVKPHEDLEPDHTHPETGLAMGVSGEQVETQKECRTPSAPALVARSLLSAERQCSSLQSAGPHKEIGEALSADDAQAGTKDVSATGILGQQPEQPTPSGRQRALDEVHLAMPLWGTGSTPGGKNTTPGVTQTTPTAGRTAARRPPLSRRRGVPSPRVPRVINPAMHGSTTGQAEVAGPSDKLVSKQQELLLDPDVEQQEPSNQVLPGAPSQTMLNAALKRRATIATLECSTHNHVPPNKAETQGASVEGGLMQQQQHPTAGECAPDAGIIVAVHNGAAAAAASASAAGRATDDAVAAGGVAAGTAAHDAASAGEASTGDAAQGDAAEAEDAAEGDTGTDAAAAAGTAHAGTGVATAAADAAAHGIVAGDAGHPQQPHIVQELIMTSPLPVCHIRKGVEELLLVMHDPKPTFLKDKKVARFSVCDQAGVPKEGSERVSYGSLSRDLDLDKCKKPSPWDKLRLLNARDVQAPGLLMTTEVSLGKVRDAVQGWASSQKAAGVQEQQGQDGLAGQQPAPHDEVEPAPKNRRRNAMEVGYASEILEEPVKVDMPILEWLPIFKKVLEEVDPNLCERERAVQMLFKAYNVQEGKRVIITQADLLNPETLKEMDAVLEIKLVVNVAREMSKALQEEVARRKFSSAKKKRVQDGVGFYIRYRKREGVYKEFSKQYRAGNTCQESGPMFKLLKDYEEEGEEEAKGKTARAAAAKANGAYKEDSTDGDKDKEDGGDEQSAADQGSEVDEEKQHDVNKDEVPPANRATQAQRQARAQVLRNNARTGRQPQVDAPAPAQHHAADQGPAHDMERVEVQAEVHMQDDPIIQPQPGANQMDAAANGAVHVPHVNAAANAPGAHATHVNAGAQAAPVQPSAPPTPGLTDRDGTLTAAALNRAHTYMRALLRAENTDSAKLLHRMFTNCTATAGRLQYTMLYIGFVGIYEDDGASAAVQWLKETLQES